MKKFFDFIKPFLLQLLLLVIAAIIIKFFEFIGSEPVVDYKCFFNGLLYLFISFSVCSLFILLVFCLASFINKKFGIIFSAVLFSCVVLIEVGLLIFNVSTGALMGKDLFFRPFYEISHTVVSSSNLTFDIILIILLFSVFIAIPFCFYKKKFIDKLLRYTLILFFIGNMLALVMNKLLNNENVEQKKQFITSKSWYLFRNIMYKSDYGVNIDFTVLQEDVDESVLDDFQILYPEINAKNPLFPFERNSLGVNDVLSPFFKDSGKLPNVVIIIVESLGRDLCVDIENGHSFTPFLDSLIEKSLYWENCLSAAPRSYAAVPAITASVPHGNKGFQFGMMPAHKSLFTILKNNNYVSNCFYGGDLTFDAVSKYLIYNNVDFCSNYLPELPALKKKNMANEWGVRDESLFLDSFERLNSITTPFFGLYITLSSHDAFSGRKDAISLDNKYRPIAKAILDNFSDKTKEKYSPFLDKITPFIYTDECLRNFFMEFSKRQDYDNTIFIITGDHALGKIIKNDLSYYHTPLVIYSPLLQKTKKMKALVTHNDIAPAIIALLQNKYKLRVPENVAWVGNSLDTTSYFTSNRKLLLLDYDRVITSMIYNDYFYESKTSWRNECFYKIVDNLDLIPLKYDENIKQKITLFKYINSYVYNNDKLISENKKENFILIDGYLNNDKIVCSYSENISYENKDSFNITVYKKNINGGYKRIVVDLFADLFVNDVVYIDSYMTLNICCKANGNVVNYKESITKYVKDEIINKETTYQIFANQYFDVSGSDKIEVTVFIAPPGWSVNWAPNKTITVSNLKIYVYGEK